jgi:uncharacterized protein YqgC (DUF456 family)
MAVALLAAALVAALLLVPLGLPGTWLMLAAGVGYNLLVPASPIGWITLGTGVALATAGEVLEWTLSLRYTRRYGGSRRAGWGALLGGLAGAIVGVPIPVIGSMIGAFAGAFAGALIAEYSRREATAGSAGRVATGALLGRIAATAAKSALALAIAVILLVAAWRATGSA